MNKNELVLFESKDGAVTLPVSIESETVWLTQAQMAELFEKDRTVIGRHIRNAITDGEIDRQSMCAKFAHMGKEPFIFSSATDFFCERMALSGSPTIHLSRLR